jgi:hypothetical protein
MVAPDIEAVIWQSGTGKSGGSSSSRCIHAVIAGQVRNYHREVNTLTQH